MSFHKILKQLQTSKEFQEFKKKHKKAFLFSAFFTLTPDFSVETQQLDFYFSKHVATFFINQEIKHKIEEFEPKGKITELNKNIKIDIDKLQGIIKKEIEKQKLQAFDLSKIIAILQKANISSKKGQQEQQIWNVTCLFSSFKMLRLHVECFNGKILKSEQASILDFVQVKK